MQTVCELTPGQVLAYRLLAPLITGAAVLGLIFVSFVDPLRNADLPDWLPSIALRALALAVYAGTAFGLGHLVAAVPRRVEFDGKAIRITRLFSGRSHERMLSEVAALSVGAPGTVSLRFTDGSRLNLEGRSGPALVLLTTAVPSSPL